MSTRFQQRQFAKTANYSILPPMDQAGSLYTNRGAAGPVTFTLPKPTLALKGWWYEFLGVADQNVIVAAPAGTGVAFNNAGCTSLAFQTAGQRIGAEIKAQCDGTSWIFTGRSVGVTYTVT